VGLNASVGWPTAWRTRLPSPAPKGGGGTTPSSQGSKAVCTHMMVDNEERLVKRVKVVGKIVYCIVYVRLSAGRGLTCVWRLPPKSHTGNQLVETTKW